MACGISSTEGGCAGFWWESLKERDHLEYLDIDGKIILKSILKKYNGSMWTGSIWLRTGTSDSIL